MDTLWTTQEKEFYRHWARAVNARYYMTTGEKMSEAGVWRELERRYLEARTYGDQTTMSFVLETAKELADRVVFRYGQAPPF